MAEVVVFLGSGELRKVLQELAQIPPPIKAVFLGFQNQTLLSRYYHAADRSLTSAIGRAMALTGRPEIRERRRQKVSGYTVAKAAEGLASVYWDVVWQVYHAA